MCGRIARASSREVLADEFGIARFVNVDLRPRYNIPPCETVEAIVRNGAENYLEPMRWGFCSSGEDRGSLTPITARAETIATTSLFRDAFRRHRCLIVADEFYEWRRDGRQKTPYFVCLRSHRPLGFAGVWIWQRAAIGTRIPTCAILTCPPNELMAKIHDRMPVIVPATIRGRWLGSRTETADLQSLLVPLPSDEWRHTRSPPS